MGRVFKAPRTYTPALSALVSPLGTVRGRTSQVRPLYPPRRQSALPCLALPCLDFPCLALPCLATPPHSRQQISHDERNSVTRRRICTALEYQRGGKRKEERSDHRYAARGKEEQISDQRYAKMAIRCVSVTPRSQVASAMMPSHGLRRSGLRARQRRHGA